jgi:hypothetical protein
VKKDLAKPIDYPDFFKYEKKQAREASIALEKKRSKRQAGKEMYRYQRFETPGSSPKGFDATMMDRMDRLLPKLGRPKKKITLEEIQEIGKLSQMVDLITKAKYVEELLPPGEKMKLWAEGKFGIYFEKSKIFKEFSSLEEAKYVLYSQIHSASSGRVNRLLYKVPKDETVVKRAVAEYEKYLSQMREGLVKAFRKRKIPKEAAEEMTRQIMKEKS